MHVVHMTTHFTPPVLLLLPPPPLHVRVPTLLRPTYVANSVTLPRSFRVSSFPRRNYFFRPNFTMPSAFTAAYSAGDDGELNFPVELSDESDFDRIVSSDGLISVCGFGSLLSERSARSTFPDLINFRVAKLSGFRRVFAHSAPIFFERRIAKPETKEISSLSVEPCEGESLIVTIFEIQRSEIPAFIEREHEFRFLAVIPETLNGLFYINPAIICARYSDEEYLKTRCRGDKDIFFQRYGRYNIDKIWRDDILPCRVYLRHCVLAAQNLGDLAYDNFLDHTFLGDRRTTIREYFSTTGSGIMEEEPPELLKERYGG
ncbi:uncharacterized protein LOC132039583 [Lycium ferocissimum]|uniref:uncharacterized protein LOC132039583 n=1 Tax=Lycium ferocissimum TaxID=112874 RepID=UPI002814F762|nr:uncharacterized protein LOC132039583 [Lycium ferocissimum]